MLARIIPGRRRARIAHRPLLPMRDKPVPDILKQLLQRRPATPVSFSCVSRLTAATALPSAMFCLQERAACVIWSTVRSPYVGKNRRQNTTVPW